MLSVVFWVKKKAEGTAFIKMSLRSLLGGIYLSLGKEGGGTQVLDVLSYMEFLWKVKIIHTSGVTLEILMTYYLAYQLFFDL